MKIAVVGAKGNLGRKLVDKALGRGHEVVSIYRHGEEENASVSVVKKSLFDLVGSDLCGVDVVLSAFGGGLKSDPTLNRQAFDTYRDLIQETGIPFLVIAGAGSLFTDKSHTMHEYEAPNHPSFLKAISENICLGIEDLESSGVKNWVVVCPSRVFDLDAEAKGYSLDTTRTVAVNEDGNSYVTYEDLADAMLDLAESGAHRGEVLSVLSCHGGKER